jgi:hypothetical protein
MNLSEMQVFYKNIFAEYTEVKEQNCWSHMKKLQEQHWQWSGIMDEAWLSEIDRTNTNEG